MRDEHNADELVELAALDALEPAEARQVEAHSAGCASCLRSLAAARAAVDQLAIAAPHRTAPAALRQRVLDAIAAPDVAAPLDAVAGLPDPTPRRYREQPRTLRRWGALAAAVIAVPVLGLLAWSLLLQRQVDDLQQQSRQLQESQRDLVLLAVPPASIRVRMVVADGAGAARGSVTWAPEQGRCAVVASGLPVNDRERVYHVFYQDPGGIHDAGQLQPDANGSAEVLFNVARWKGSEYQVWVAPARPGGEPGGTILSAMLRRE